MNILPSLDQKTIERDRNGTIFIKPMPILTYFLTIVFFLFALGALVRGQIFLGIAGIVGGIFYIVLVKKQGTSFEFNAQNRTFIIRTGPKSFTISFDEIAGFGVETTKETINFTEENILVMRKDGGGIYIGTITDANRQKRAEKVSNMLKFLYESTGIVINENESDQLVGMVDSF